MEKLSQKGAAHILLLLAVIGIVAYIGVSSAAPFKDKLFSQLYPKKASNAQSLSEPIGTASATPISMPTPIPTPIVMPTSTPYPTSRPTPTSFPTSKPTPTPTPTVRDIVPPAVNISYPLSGSIVNKKSTVSITANAADNVGVTRVEFYINGDLRCLDGAAPYSCSWSVPKDPRVRYNITAKALDSAGNNSTSSINVTSR